MLSPSLEVQRLGPTYLFTLLALVMNFSLAMQYFDACQREYNYIFSFNLSIDLFLFRQRFLVLFVYKDSVFVSLTYLVGSTCIKLFS